MENILYEIIEKKEFSDLNFEEKELVLSQITKEQYEDIRFLLTNSKNQYQNSASEFEIQSQTKNYLSSVYRNKYSKPKTSKIHFGLWQDYKKMLIPSLSIASVFIILAMIYIKTNSNFLLKDTHDVSSYLTENKALLKINKDHSSDLIDSNKINKDSIVEMINYLEIRLEGLYVN